MSETEPKGKMDFETDFDVDQNKTLRRPWVAFFHFFFRISALVIYLFGTAFSGSFIGVFVTVVLLLSLDFWTVKNVSGRIMVSIHYDSIKLLSSLEFFLFMPTSTSIAVLSSLSVVQI